MNTLLDKAFIWSFGALIGSVVALLLNIWTPAEAFLYAFVVPVNILAFAFMYGGRVKEIKS